MMFKKIITTASAAGLLALSVSASATPIAFQGPVRVGSPVEKAEHAGGSSVVPIVIVGAIGIAIIALIQRSTGKVEDLPASP